MPDWLLAVVVPAVPVALVVMKMMRGMLAVRRRQGLDFVATIRALVFHRAALVVMRWYCRSGGDPAHAARLLDALERRQLSGDYCQNSSSSPRSLSVPGAGRRRGQRSAEGRSRRAVRRR